MNTLNINNVLSKADGYIQDARNELCRAEEDVVPQLIFNNVRNAMNLILKKYLSQNSEGDISGTLQELAQRCGHVEPIFNDLKIDLIPHEGNEQMRYINLDSLEKCIQVAEKARGILKEPSWPESKHIK